MSPYTWAKARRPKRDRWVRRYAAWSRQTGHKHTVAVDRQGRWGCDCWVWRRNQQEDCEHIIWVKEQLAEAERILKGETKRGCVEAVGDQS